MSTVPTSREQLEADLERAYGKFVEQLDAAGPRAGGHPCVDDWSLKDLLAVRVWWSESVASWAEAGLRGETPETPAPGYRWNETPRLNADTVRRERRTSLRALRERLRTAYPRIREIIARMTDEELLEPGSFAWTGRYSAARLIAMNTTRQYTTANSLIRKAIR